MNAFTNTTPEPEDDPNRSASSKGSSRLDREVAEILARSQESAPLPPIPFRERVEAKTRQQAAKVRAESRSQTQDRLAQVMRTILAYPIITAVALGILCAMVSDASPLLARVFAIAAVAMVLYPMARDVRAPASRQDPKIWRGQVFDSRPPASSPIDDVKRWFRSRR